MKKSVLYMVYSHKVKNIKKNYGQFTTKKYAEEYRDELKKKFGKAKMEEKEIELKKHQWR